MVMERLDNDANEIRIRRLERITSSLFDGQQDAIRSLAEHTGQMQKLGQRLDVIERRLDLIEGRLDGLEKRMDGLEKRMGRLEERMDSLEKRIEALELRMDGLETQIANLTKLVGHALDDLAYVKEILAPRAKK